MVNIDKIKALAKASGFKLGYLCELLGEDQNYFNKVKLGLRRMDENRIQYLADKLGTTYDYLVDLTDDPAKPTPGALALRTPRFSYDRFFDRCIYKHVTVGYVESRVGLRHGSIEDARAKNLQPTDATVNNMAIVLDTTYEYLMGLSDEPGIPLDDKTGIKIKVFGDVAAGIPIQQIDNFDPDDSDSWEEIDRRTAKSGSYFALRIKGDSMLPRICSGDTVIVRWQNTIESDEIAVVAINGDTATCKKVVYDQSGGMFLIALNPAFPPMYFTAEEIEEKPVTILGKVVELRAKI